METEQKIKDALVNRFLAAKDWGIFEKVGTPISNIFQAGKISIIDVSHYMRVTAGWSVRGMLVGLLSRKIFQERLMARKAEEIFSREKTNNFDEMDLFDIVGHTIDIMQNAIMESKMAGYTPDIIIGIPNNACGFYEFNKGYELIELGKLITKEQLGVS